MAEVVNIANLNDCGGIHMSQLLEDLAWGHIDVKKGLYVLGLLCDLLTAD